MLLHWSLELSALFLHFSSILIECDIMCQLSLKVLFHLAWKSRLFGKEEMQWKDINKSWMHQWHSTIIFFRIDFLSLEFLILCPVGIYKMIRWLLGLSTFEYGLFMWHSFALLWLFESVWFSLLQAMLVLRLLLIG